LTLHDGNDTCDDASTHDGEVVSVLLQEFVRGMRSLSEPEVTAILSKGMSAPLLWRDPSLSAWDAEALLTDANLDRHRHDHEDFGARSPYISTSAGTYQERGILQKYNQPLFALETAVHFAVVMGRTDGWVFYGYHFILGRPAGRHAEFSEELRDVHQHPQWSRYRGEGEMAAALRIPARRLQKAEYYSYTSIFETIESRGPLKPDRVVDNAEYQPPETVLSVRRVI
jgi:hypothetical protein